MTRAFTLRLPPDKHIRLRAAVIITGQSGQQITEKALDAYLATVPGVDRAAKALEGETE